MRKQKNHWFNQEFKPDDNTAVIRKAHGGVVWGFIGFEWAGQQRCCFRYFQLCRCLHR